MSATEKSQAAKTAWNLALVGSVLFLVYLPMQDAFSDPEAPGDYLAIS